MRSNYLDQDTLLGKALNQTYLDILKSLQSDFSSSTTNRQKAVVILSDGASKDDTEIAAKLLRSLENVQVFTVGVGYRVNKPAIWDTASHLKNEHSFVVEEGYAG